MSEQTQAASPKCQASGRSVLGWCAAVGVVAIAVPRCLVAFESQLLWHFDAAAAMDSGQRIGPSGAALCDWLCIAVLLLALTARRWRGPGHGVMVLWWAVGAAVWLWHGWHDAAALRIGGNWAGATALGLAALHLAGDARLKKFIVLGLLATIIPLSAAAVYQVAVEHPQTVRNYEQNQQWILRQQQIEPGSIEQRKYETRLMQNEATGRFGLANVFGSVTMTLTLGAAGLTIAWRKRRVALIVGSAVTLLGLIGLALSFSKGAVGALGVTAAGLAVVWAIARWRKWRGWWVVGVMAIVMMGVAGVLGRAAMGVPDTAEGERSLLFRAMYWQGAVEMFINRQTPFPGAGVGPGHFKEQFSIVKPPVCPEDVTDPHNVFVAMVSMLGLGGAAWGALAIGWLGRAAAGVCPAGGDVHAAGEGQAEGDSLPRAWWPATVIAGGLAFTMVMAVRLATLEAVWWVMPLLAVGLAVLARRWWREGRLVGWGVLAAVLGAFAIVLPFVGVPLAAGAVWIALVGLAGRLPLNDSPWARLGVLAAATAMLLHNQIEMAMTNTMAAPLLWALLGAAAGQSWPAERRGEGAVRGVRAWIAPALVLAIALAALWPVVGLMRQYHRADAGVTLLASGDARGAAAMFEQAWRTGPHEPRFAAAAARAHGSAGRFERAVALLAEARKHGDNLGQLWRTESRLATVRALRTHDRRALDRAVEAARRALPFSPHSARAHLAAADIAHLAGRMDLARRWYAEALRLNANAYLDPDGQLPLADVSRAEARRE